MKTVGATAPELFEILMPVYKKAGAFPEVKPMLEATRKELKITTAILSNGTPDMLEAGAKNAGNQSAA